MLKIYTAPINNRPDWFIARATINGHTYVAWAIDRVEALRDVLKQIMSGRHSIAL